MIQITQLHKKFGKNKVLRGIDLQIQNKGIIAILGPNGSGKTTLIKALLGMVLPDKGSIFINGTDIKNQWRYRKEIEYLPQIADFPNNLKVRELINLLKDLHQQTVNEVQLIDLFGLQPFLDKKLATLSGGTKQKVNILLTFMFDKPLIILDEPTTGLDPMALIHLKELIQYEKANGKTILLTSHIMHFVEEVADEIIYLLEGKVYFKGTVEELKGRTKKDNVEHAIAVIANNSDHV
jgi:Cu-processing system ATP-binding protein